MMTRAFALNGAHKVYIIGRRKEKLEEAAEKIATSNVVPVVGDVTDKSSLLSIAETIKQETGYINLLCCNSGIMGTPMPFKAGEVPAAEFAKAGLERWEDWNRSFATNSTAIPMCTFAFIELLDAGNQKGNCTGRKSQVLVTSSIAGYLRVPGSNLSYSASKAAATHMVKHLAGTLVPYNIRMNGIAPGLFPSDLAGHLIAGVKPSGEPTEEGSIGKNVIPAQRTGRDSDIEGTLLFLASAAGAYLNGNIMVLDGGRMSQLPGTY